MASNVFTKNEILQNLASKGYFIDAYTLDTFFAQWQIEAIFEDEQGSEFYDKNALDVVLNNLFNAQNTDQAVQEEVEIKELKPPKENNIQIENYNPAPMPNAMPAQNMAQNFNQGYNQNFNQPFQQGFNQNQQFNYQQQQMMNQQMPFQQGFNQMPNVNQNFNQPNFQNQNFNNFNGFNNQPAIQNNPQQIKQNVVINDSETSNLLNSISLSDGVSLMDKIQESPNLFDIPEDFSIVEPSVGKNNEFQQAMEEKKAKTGILEGAMQAAGQEYVKEIPPSDIESPSEETSDFDDISLLSESLEAQEKLRDYVVSELSKKNFDMTPKSNEFKLDISEKTIGMVARTMAKKIAKHVTSLCSQNAANPAQLAELQEENKRLEQKTKDLEDQNKKLRLLLAESNKNLNSYKPSLFGFYRKVNPK